MNKIMNILHKIFGTYLVVGTKYEQLSQKTADFCSLVGCLIWCALFFLVAFMFLPSSFLVSSSFVALVFVTWHISVMTYRYLTGVYK